MGKKYVIELEDKAFSQSEAPLTEDEMLYRVKGFRSLVFDKNGLDKLKPLYGMKELEDDAYKRGLDDAWMAAIKLDRIDSDEWEKCFGETYYCGALGNHTPEEAISKLKIYENDKDSFCPGDVVETKEGKKLYITYIDDDDGSLCGLYNDGDTFYCRTKDDCRKIGHFDFLDAIRRVLQNG